MSTTTAAIKFGTDGWRGTIAQDFTFDNVRACAQGVADYIIQTDPTKRSVVIGYDTRFASDDFAAACAEVMAANGVKAFLCTRPTPTPVVSFGVTHKEARGGIIITASHNPARDNGFKYKTGLGYSAPPEVAELLEKKINDVLTAGKIDRMPLAEALSRGLVEYVSLDGAYRERIAGLVDMDAICRSRLEVVHDVMYGSGAGYLRALLAGGRVRLTELNGRRNPLFPGIKQPEPIAVNLTRLSATVRRKKASIGIATDGDADRLGIVDETGRFLTQLEVFALLAYYLLEVRRERGAIVKTITTTSMLDRLAEIYGVPIYETAVGFKYVAPLMLKVNGLIGGEESGGYGFRGHVLERDGILAGLYFLNFMVDTGKSPSELLERLFKLVGPHYYKRDDIGFPETERERITGRLAGNVPKQIDGVKVARFQTIDGFRYVLADNTWLLIRFSGTEPLMRIYAESSSPERVDRMLDTGRRLAGL